MLWDGQSMGGLFHWRGAIGIDLTRSDEVPDELEDMDFSLFAHAESMSPDLFQSVHAKRKFMH